MTDVLARIKLNGKHFETLVDLDKALEFKRSGKGDISSIASAEEIFTDLKKGMRAPEADMKSCFKTAEFNEIIKKIILQGEIQIPAEYMEKQREGKLKQVVDFLAKNAVDPRTDRPYTPERIENSLREAGVNVSNKPVESQIHEIIQKLSLVMPIKIETKRIKLTVPAQFTGQSYGLINPYKESEEWRPNGELVAIIKLPVGLQMDFYDKLNSITHGSALSEELKENK